MHLKLHSSFVVRFNSYNHVMDEITSVRNGCNKDVCLPDSGLIIFMEVLKNMQHSSQKEHYCSDFVVSVATSHLIAVVKSSLC